MQILRYGILSIFLSIPLVAHPFQQHPAPLAFSVDQILSFPSPENLVASPVGSTIAWTFNERGVRNIYVADGPRFEPRRVTAYGEDDGQEGAGGAGGAEVGQAEVVLEQEAGVVVDGGSAKGILHGTRASVLG